MSAPSLAAALHANSSSPLSVFSHAERRSRHAAHFVWIPILALLAGCAGQDARQSGDDADEIPASIARIPDAVPRIEPLAKSGNPESYVVFGKRYYTKPNSRGYVERGLASWYGEPFHGRKTSSGEIYDMHGMSAAHKTLPLPTYARVTNVANGRSVVIRINDRGPFHGPRLIDLSHTAAVKLGVVKAGTALVEVRAIDPARPAADPGPFLAQRSAARTQATRAPSAPPPATPAPARVTAAAARVSSSPAAIPVAAIAASHPARTPATGAASGRAITRGAPLYLQIGAFGDPRNAERLRTRLTTHVSPERIRILDPNAGDAALYKVRIGPLASEDDAERLARKLSALGVDTARRVRN